MIGSTRNTAASILPKVSALQAIVKDPVTIDIGISAQDRKNTGTSTIAFFRFRHQG